MRAGTQNRNSEFIIAQNEQGGAAPDYYKAKEPSSKAPNKEPEGHFHHMARVRAGLNKPSTIFSSIGGRNSGSTTVGSGGQYLTLSNSDKGPTIRSASRYMAAG
ncbi:hypothetical protein BG000_001819 [Podila horticola]|nr:hypothetical protein BG000_001819 [Podila horticola]